MFVSFGLVIALVVAIAVPATSPVRVGWARGLTSFLVAFAGGSLFDVGVVALVYQGYREDAGNAPAQTWPIALGAFMAAGLAILVARLIATGGRKP